MIQTVTVSREARDGTLARALESLSGDLAVRILVSDTLEAAVHCCPVAGIGTVLVDDVISLDALAPTLCALVEMKNGIVFAQTQTLAREWKRFAELRTLVVAEFGLKLVPVDSPQQAARYIARIVHQHSRPAKPQSAIAPPTNKHANADASLVKSVSGIPGIGDAKARDLLTRFGSLRAIADARADEIAKVKGFGAVNADKVTRFFGEEKEMRFL
ncbi:hypothetical protein BC830DRAFT_1126797 [Chytriomyces sp. MP71]|nr:hypothetical protein BC830DRAFT_1126797 [Chytriomyces sp. MP71]